MKSQLKVVEQGNTISNIKKLQVDFYFTTFNPEDHYTLQTIFWDLPRLSNIANDEWVLVKVFNRCLLKPWGFISDGEMESGLTHCSSSSWTLKDEFADTSQNIGNDNVKIGIQKKFVPGKGLGAIALEKKGLIVAASLVDKVANLGGLARTCEVFQAERLLVPSLNLIEDKSFISLSSSAEKHLDILEVKPHNMMKFLLEIKEEGYKIVGAEQASESIPLSKFEFPLKTVLVLGNEKEGIPVSLLPLLDQCIEIPQFGLIRSLNVHVTGAIFIWEYAKQHKIHVSNTPV